MALLAYADGSAIATSLSTLLRPPGVLPQARDTSWVDDAPRKSRPSSRGRSLPLRGVSPDHYGEDSLEALFSDVTGSPVPEQHESPEHSQEQPLTLARNYAGETASTKGAGAAASGWGTMGDAVELADRLLSEMPGMDRVVFASAGSREWLAAFEMVRQVSRNVHGGAKHKILIRERDCHGVDLLASSEDFVCVPDACTYRSPEGEGFSGLHAADEIEEAILEAGPDAVGALCVETIAAQGGAGASATCTAPLPLSSLTFAAAVLQQWASISADFPCSRPSVCVRSGTANRLLRTSAADLQAIQGVADRERGVDRSRPHGQNVCLPALLPQARHGDVGTGRWQRRRHLLHRRVRGDCGSLTQQNSTLRVPHAGACAHM